MFLDFKSFETFFKSIDMYSVFLVFFKKDEIQQLDISADEAFQLILSGGLAFNDPSSLSKFKF